MATSPLPSVQQYLAIDFSEREPLATRKDSSVRLDSAGFCGTEVRMKLAGDLFRIPDLAVFKEPPLEQTPASPPLVVVEITSPDDRHQDLLQKLDEYKTWGVQHVWVIEPELKKFHEYIAGGLAQATEFELPEFNFRVTAAELFAQADARA